MKMVSIIPTISYIKSERKYIHMENKNNFTFSFLNSIGWFLTIANIAGITQLKWANIGTYWLTLLLICLATAIIDPLVNKGGEK